MSKTYCYHLESSNPTEKLEYLGIDDSGAAIIVTQDGKRFAVAPSSLAPEEGAKPLHSKRVK